MASITSKRLLAVRNDELGTENAFKIGPHIVRVEAEQGPVVRLNLGEPDFAIPTLVKDEVKRQLDADNTHYCDPKGIPSLRQAIAKQMRELRGLDVSPERIVIFPGAKPSIGFAQQIYCEPGDEVIYPSPGFPIYESFIRYIGASPVPLHLREEAGFTFSPADLESLLSSRTKLIFLNFPSNPTGGVASRELLEGIADVIKSSCGPEVRVYSDEIYEYITYDDQKHYSIASIPGMEERTIISSGVSKSFAWTGGRVGYIVAPTVEEADAFKNLNINYFSCVPPYNQEGARVAIENQEVRKEVRVMVRTFQERRDRILQQLNAIDGITCQKPGGAFYLFPNIQGVCEKLGVFQAFESLHDAVQLRSSPATLFQMFALYRHRVATMDRRSFGSIGAEGQHFLRLSIAADLKQLEEGVRRLKAAAEDVDGFRSFLDEASDLL